LHFKTGRIRLTRLVRSGPNRTARLFVKRRRSTHLQSSQLLLVIVLGERNGGGARDVRLLQFRDQVVHCLEQRRDLSRVRDTRSRINTAHRLPFVRLALREPARAVRFHYPRGSSRVSRSRDHRSFDKRPFATRNLIDGMRARSFVETVSVPVLEDYEFSETRARAMNRFSQRSREINDFCAPFYQEFGPSNLSERKSSIDRR